MVDTDTKHATDRGSKVSNSHATQLVELQCNMMTTSSHERHLPLTLVSPSQRSWKGFLQFDSNRPVTESMESHYTSKGAL